LKTQAGITRLRGRLFRVDGRKVVPIYHPAAALYDRTKQDVLYADFQRLKAVLDSFDETGRAAQQPSEDSGHTPGDAAGETGVEQPTLF
jgi:DNA polymerase